MSYELSYNYGVIKMSAIDQLQDVFEALGALNETPKQTIERINGYKIKAKAYDDLMAANHEVVQGNILLSQLQSKLKEIEELSNKYHDVSSSKIKRILEGKAKS